MSSRLEPWVTGAAFLLTGVGTALLGAALPAMLSEWQLSDRSGGQLLFCAFAGSTLGALLVHRAYRLLAAAGLAVTGVAAVVLAHVPGGLNLLPAFLFYGTGLGVTMTSISLLRSREASSTDSHLEMNRLNLLWAVGACLAPALALRSLHRISVRGLFLGEGITLMVMAVALLFAKSHPPARDSRGLSLNAGGSLPPVPLRLWLFAAAAVALETAIGSWLTTYAERVAHRADTAVGANFTFWVGLLLSRAAHSWRGAQSLRSRQGLRWHLGLAALGTVLLIAASGSHVLPVAGLLAGLGLGPLYPLALALALPNYRSTAIFVMTGVGAAVLPWVTGALSTSFGSLRAGLLAPCATVVILLVAARALRYNLPDPTQIRT